MAIEISSLSIRQGDTLAFRVYAKDSDGNALDLTDYAARGYIRQRYSSTGVLVNLAPSVHSSFVSGIVDVSVPSSTTSTLPVDQLVWDIEVFTSADAVVYKVANGYLDVLPEATW